MAIALNLDIPALVAIGGAAVGLVGWLWRTGRKAYGACRQFAVVWNYLTERGEIEARRSGVYELPDEPGNQVPAWVREKFTGLADRLREAYRAEWAGLKKDEAKFRIEERFGAEIVAQVCRPLSWHGGQCLQAAWLIAREPVGYAAPDSKQAGHGR